MKRHSSLWIMLLFTAFLHAQSYSGGSGTENDPYLISSKSDLETLAETVDKGNAYKGKYFLLTTDLNEITTTVGLSTGFSGIFDGGGHVIGVNMIDETFIYNRRGVFGRAYDATIKNLGVSGIIVATTNLEVGGICGIANNCTITNCYNSADVSTVVSNGGGMVGGLCGYAVSCTITQCHNTGDIIGRSYAGGICGSSPNSSISMSYNEGNVSASLTITSTSVYAGGISGGYSYDKTTITDCYNTGNISASLLPTVYCEYQVYAGGICGRQGVVSNSYNSGNVSSVTSNNATTAYAGGICAVGTATNCFVVNETITCTGGKKAVGERITASGTVTNCYATPMTINDTQVNGTEKNGVSGEDVTPESFKELDWITENLGWDFDDNWKISADGLPILQYQDEDAGPPTGSNDLKLSGNVKIYSQNNTLFIDTDAPIDMLKLYNQSGICIKTINNPDKEIDMPLLPTGLYIVCIHSENGITTHKIIKN